MKKGEQTRARIVDTAMRLFESQGYSATGLKQLLAESNSPRGSFYFHFPEGKSDLALAVIERHTKSLDDTLTLLLAKAPSTTAAVHALIDTLAARIDQSHCEAGCAVTTLALEMANRSAPVKKATQLAYETWASRLATRLVDEGHSAAHARGLARTFLSAVEGALILCRAYGDATPLMDVKRHITPMLAL